MAIKDFPPSDDSITLATRFEGAAIALRLLAAGLDQAVRDLGENSVLVATNAWEGEEYEQGVRDVLLGPVDELYEIAASLRGAVPTVTKD